MTDNKNVNMPDLKTVEQYHDLGWMPDRYYNQLNGKSAQENYADWRNGRNKEEPDETDYSDIHITSEVNIKK